MSRLTFPILTGALLTFACSGDGSGGGNGDGNGMTSGGTPGSGGLAASGGVPGAGGDLLGAGGTGGLASGGAGAGGGTETGGALGTGGDTGTGGEIGSGGAPPAPTYTLSGVGGSYTYSVGTSSMTIDPNDGGRVTSFLVEGHETLVQSGGEASQYGSVFWPSPQSLYPDPDNWPPPPEIDSGAYQAVTDGDQLTLTSAEAPSVGLQVIKTFAPTHTPGGTPAISVTYTMTNRGTLDVAVAGWEISRVGTNGLAFFRTGPAGQTDSQENLMVTASGDHSWYLYDGMNLNGIPKIFADGMDGWLAWSTGEAIVIKSFPDVMQSSFAPGEAEIEIYADPSGTYFEVEQQGPLQTIAVGASATWTVLWVGVDIPDGADTSLGSADLIQAVTGAL